MSEGRAAAEAGGLLLPRHDRATFRAFIGWLASDAERACALSQVAIAVRAFGPQLRLTDWSADGEIAGLMEQLSRRAADGV